MKLIMIGPMGIGKSTISQILSEKLKLRRYDFDELRNDMYINMREFSKEREREIALNEARENLFEYWKPFDVEQMETLLLNNNEGIFDVGGGHVVQSNQTLYQRVYHLLKDEPYVFNLYFSNDIEESIEALSYRKDIPTENLEFYARLNADFIRANIYKDFSKFNICVKNKSYEDIAVEIIKTVN